MLRQIRSGRSFLLPLLLEKVAPYAGGNLYRITLLALSFYSLVFNSPCSPCFLHLPNLYEYHISRAIAFPVAA